MEACTDELTDEWSYLNKPPIVSSRGGAGGGGGGVKRYTSAFHGYFTSTENF